MYKTRNIFIVCNAISGDNQTQCLKQFNNQLTPGG